MPLAVRAAVLGLLHLAAALGASASARGSLVARVVPRPGGDQVLVARTATGGTVLERWQAWPPRRLAARSVPGRVVDIVPEGRYAALQLAHRIDLVPADLNGPPRRLWHTRLRIARTVAIRGAWLVLACRPSRGGHAQRGQVFHVSAAGARRLSVSGVYNVWDIQAGDVDGSGRPEVALCTWSRTRRDPSLARRYFIYGWDGRDLGPRWCGSRLSKPYRQARLVRFDDRPGWGLLSVERTRSGRWCLVAYRWTGFGFAGMGQSEEVTGAEVLEAPGPPALVRVVRPGARQAVCAVALGRAGMHLVHVCRTAAGEPIVAGRFTAGGPRRIVAITSTPAGGTRLHSRPRPSIVTAR